MNRISVIVSAFAIAASSAMTVGASAPTAAAEVAVSATARLSDGSTVKGDLLAAKVTGSTLFLKKLDLDPAIVKSIAFQGTNNTAAVELVNGDKFTMTVLNEAFAVNTLLGKLDIPRANIRSLVFARRRAAADGAEPGLVFYCTFDDEASVSTPAVGPKGRFVQGEFAQGKVGMALQATVYSPNAAFELPSGFFKTSGCIEFWAKILKQSPYIGAGGDPRLFTITPKSSGNIICTLDIVSNNGSGNSGFSTWTFLGNMASLRGCRVLRYDDLFSSGNGHYWHHYAIVWDKDGIAGLDGMPTKALFIDGKPVQDVQNHIRKAEEVTALLSSPTMLSFTIDPDLDPELTTKSPFLIDEFKIWDCARTSFDIEP